MNINIYGSTGTIGIKSLNIVNQYFKNIKINLLCCNNNDTLLLKQIYKYKPKYAFIYNEEKYLKIKKKNIKNTKILSKKELFQYLKSSNSKYSILAVSGYRSLYYLDEIIINTENLGIVSKESIVSAGHIFRKKKYFNKTNIFPLDSEHFSLFAYLNNNKSNNINKVFLTASGGPFYKYKFSHLKNIKFKDAIKHPKWKMGYKNSIDSATLVNKCLEIVEAHYLFDIPYKKLDIRIHPQAFVHSIVENTNFVSHMNLFKNDMSIPIINFLIKNKSKFMKINHNYQISTYPNLQFHKVNYVNFPIYKLFNKMNKEKPVNLIKFNVGNEVAVNLFKDGKIKYTDIYKIIKKAISLNLYSSLNNIKDIIQYHEKIENRIKEISNTNF